MNRHNKHYSEEEIALLIRAKEEVEEKMDSPAVKAMVSEIGGVWKYIAKVYFDSKRKPKALAEQYRKEYNRLAEEAAKATEQEKETKASDNDNVRQLPIPFEKVGGDRTLLEEVRETNRLLRRIISIMLDDNPPAGEGRLMISHAPAKKDSPGLKAAN